MRKTFRGDLQILRESLIDEFPRSIKMEFYISRYEILLISLRGWEAREEKNLGWFKNGYKKIKHDKTGNPESASLQRAFDSATALRLILLHLYRKKHSDPILPIALAPNLIVPTRVDAPSYWNSSVITWEWKLPNDPLEDSEIRYPRPTSK